MDASATTSETLPVETLLERLATVVGEEHVRALPDDARYGGLLVPNLTPEQRPRAVVQPASAEQLQQLVTLVPRLAHEIWTTPNACGNGARAGEQRRPAVLLDLSRLDRIVEVDRRAAVAVLEAGVGFDALLAHLRERDLPLATDLDANGARAVLGGLLDRHWGVGPWGERSAWFCGVEAVLRNGALLRSGIGALPGNANWARTRYAYGPALDGLFTRSALGIVTRFGLWLAPRPRRLLPFMLELTNAVALGAAVEALRPLLLDGTLGGTVAIAGDASDAALLAARGIAAPAATGGWRLYGALAGSTGRVAARWDSVRAALAALPGARLADEATADGDARWTARLRLLRGETLHHDASGRDGDALAFTVVAPPTALDARTLLRILTARLPEVDARVEFRQGPRALRLEVALPSGPRNHGARRAMALNTLAELVKAGYGIAFATPGLDDAVEVRHVDEELRGLHASVRAALDPYAPRRAAPRGDKPAPKPRAKKT